MCEKPRHKAQDCRHHKDHNPECTNQANINEANENLVAIVIETNMISLEK